MATTAQEIITLSDQIGRDPNASAAIGEAKKLQALQMILDDFNSDDLLPGSYRTHGLPYSDSRLEYPGATDFKAFIEAEPDQRATDLDVVTPESFRRRIASNDSAELLAHDWRDDTSMFLMNTLTTSKYIQVHALSSPTGNGTWVADTTDSDATNVRADNLLFRKNAGSIAFDIDVSQSANNYAELSDSSMGA